MDDRTRRSERLDETSMADVIDSAVRRIATSIAIVGVAIALAIYARPGPPHFEAFATPTGFMMDGDVLDPVDTLTITTGPSLSMIRG